MTKTELEKRSEERAKKRFEKNLNDLIIAILHNPIGERLQITVGDKKVYIAYFGSGSGLINSEGAENRNAKYTNLQDVKKGLLEEYKCEEMYKILDNIKDIDYLFNNREEYLALIEDRDHWKNLCKEISNKKIELEEKISKLKRSL